MRQNRNLRALLLTLVLILAISVALLYRVSRPHPRYAYSQVLQPPALTQAESDQPGLMIEGLMEGAVVGGRARGGGFGSSPAPSAPSPMPRSPAGGGYYPTPVPGPVFVPIPDYGYRPSPTVVVPVGGGGFDLDFVFILAIVGFALLPVVLNYVRAGSSSSTTAAPAGSTSELYNDIVTVSQIQIGLLAGARDLQRDLNTLAQQANWGKQESLSELLRETVLALLRSPEYWTHVRATSKTVQSREAGSRLFEQLSLAERSKLSAETLVNIGGRVRQQSTPQPLDNDPSAYIVVTLLVGTADDRPLFGEIRSTEALAAALRRLGSLPPSYVLIYELLWAPQDESSSLSRDELVANYPDLMQI
ncbi:DUF1517 domain-containing protein [Thermoleptolyngbya sp.]